MADGIIRVFLSSTFDEFREHREELYRAVDTRWFSFWEPEHEGPRSGSNEQRVLEEIRRSHVFVCLVGEKFGSPHPRDPAQSIVQSELAEAQQLRQTKRIPEVLVYLKEHLDTEPAQAADASQQGFVRRIRDYASGVAYATFGSVDDLREKLETRFDRLLEEFVRVYLQESESSPGHGAARKLAFRTACVVAALLSAFSLLVGVDRAAGLQLLDLRLLGREVVVLAMALAGLLFCGAVARAASGGKR